MYSRKIIKNLIYNVSISDTVLQLLDMTTNFIIIINCSLHPYIPKNMYNIINIKKN